MEIRYESLKEENTKRKMRVASSASLASESRKVVRRRHRSEEKKALLKHAVKVKERFRRLPGGELVILLNPWNIDLPDR